MAEGGPYSLLASAIAGRRLQVSLELGAGDRAYTDGSTIFAEAGASWGQVAVQALLVGAGSLQPHRVRPLRGRSRLADAYLQWEVARGLVALASRVPQALLEQDFVAQLPSPCASAEQSLAAARGKLPLAPAALGVLRPSLLLREHARLAREGQVAVVRSLHVDDGTDGSDPDLEQSRLLSMFRSPLERSSSVFAELMRDLFDLRGGGEASQDAASGALLARPGTGGGPSGSRLSLTPGAPHAQATWRLGVVHRYPEWDEERRRYRPNWTAVAVVDPPASASADGRYPAVTHRRLQRRLAAVALDHEPHRHQPRGDDVLVDDLVRWATDRAAGHSPREDVYRASLRTRRDLGVLLLSDITGSTSELGASGVPVVQEQLGLAHRLACALHGAGDRVGWYGYHSRGRELVRLQRVKAFEDGMDSSVRSRLSRLSPAGYSRLGAAVRHATTIVQRDSGVPRQLLVVISDGFAYDQAGPFPGSRLTRWRTPASRRSRS